MRNHKEKSARLKTTTRHLASHLRGGANLSSSWLLWGGVGREAGTSTVLEGWFKLRSSSPFSFRADTPFTEVETGGKRSAVALVQLSGVHILTATLSQLHRLTCACQTKKRVK